MLTDGEHFCGVIGPGSYINAVYIETRFGIVETVGQRARFAAAGVV